VIDLAWRRLQNFANFRHDRPRRNIFDGLQTDQPRLPHFFHADQIPIVGVSGCTNGNLEFVLIVGRIRRGFADVPFHSAGAEHGPVTPNAMASAAVRIPTPLVRPIQMRFFA